MWRTIRRRKRWYHSRIEREQLEGSFPHKCSSDLNSLKVNGTVNDVRHPNDRIRLGSEQLVNSIIPWLSLIGDQQVLVLVSFLPCKIFCSFFLNLLYVFYRYNVIDECTGRIGVSGGATTWSVRPSDDPSHSDLDVSRLLQICYTLRETQVRGLCGSVICGTLFCDPAPCSPTMLL